MSKKEKSVKKSGGKGGDKGQQQQRGGKQGKAPRPSESEDVKREQKLQAILLADSFSKSFRPISSEIPKVMLPLVNVPMLEYTIEFLAQNGVEEIFLFCVWHAEMLEEYVSKSKWPSILSVRCITSSACLSPGDALRELDAMNIIRSDPFILISGDVVSNINLKEAMAFHKRKCKEDINNVMTVVLKKVQKTAGAKRLLDDLVVAMDRVSSQIVTFENSCKKKSLKVSLELMEDHPRGLTFHTDLLDCNVDICSPELMVQFSDNFDYQDIRRDFIQNEVSNWSLGKHIYGYMIQNEYAARVRDFRSYHSICRDIVTRWVFPLVPDAQLLQDSTYVHTKQYAYRESGVKVARSATVGEAVVLSRGTIIGESAVLRRTIVGRDCNIGNGTTVTESHVWKGVTIGNNVMIDRSILCDGVEVGSGAVIPRGCILSYGVKIGPGVILPEFTRMSNYKPESPIVGTSNTCSEILGESSVGYIWKNSDPIDSDPDSSDEDEDDDDNNDLLVGAGDEAGGTKIDGMANNNLSGGLDAYHLCSIGCVEGEDWKRYLWSKMPVPVESDSEDDFEHDGLDGEDGFVMDMEGASARDTLNFARVVGDMVSTGHAEGHPASSLLMEIKGYKFAQNKSFVDCISGIVPALLQIVAQLCKDVGSNGVKQTAFLGKLKETMKEDAWGYTLIHSMVQDCSEQIQIIQSVEDVVLLPEYGASLYPIFRYMLQVLYDGDIISDEAILQWAALREAMDEDLNEALADTGRRADAKHHPDAGGVVVTEEERVKLFKEPQVQEFVEWIQEEDDDDDDDDDDESENDEDEDD